MLYVYLNIERERVKWSTHSRTVWLSSIVSVSFVFSVVVGLRQVCGKIDPSSAAFNCHESSRQAGVCVYVCVCVCVCVCAFSVTLRSPW